MSRWFSQERDEDRQVREQEAIDRKVSQGILLSIFTKLAQQETPGSTDYQALEASKANIATLVSEGRNFSGTLIDNITPILADKILREVGVQEETKYSAAAMKQRPIPPNPGSNDTGFIYLVGGSPYITPAPKLVERAIISAKLYQPSSPNTMKHVSDITGESIRPGTIIISIEHLSIPRSGRGSSGNSRR